MQFCGQHVGGAEYWSLKRDKGIAK